jgi:hypothetical protein
MSLDFKRWGGADGKEGQTGRHPFGEDAAEFGWKTLRFGGLDFERDSGVKNERGRRLERDERPKPKMEKTREVESSREHKALPSFKP